MDSLDAIRPPSAWEFLRVWIGIGGLSFGGGPSTLALMRRAVVEQHVWLSEEQFTRYWALCQVCPGINLLGMPVLIGRDVRGAAGIALAILGLLSPSVAITIALSATFRLAYRTDTLQAAVRGAIPATVGLGWLMSLHMGRSVVHSSGRIGKPDLALTVVLLFGSAALFASLKISPIILMLGAGAVTAAARSQALRSRSGKDAE